MQVKVKDINISTGGPLIVLLNSKDAKTLDLQGADRVILRKGKKEITVAVNISSEDSKSIKSGEIGIFEEVINFLVLM